MIKMKTLYFKIIYILLIHYIAVNFFAKLEFVCSDLQGCWRVFILLDGSFSFSFERFKKAKVFRLF